MRVVIIAYHIIHHLLFPLEHFAVSVEYKVHVYPNHVFVYPKYFFFSSQVIVVDVENEIYTTLSEYEYEAVNLKSEQGKGK